MAMPPKQVLPDPSNMLAAIAMSQGGGGGNPLANYFGGGMDGPSGVNPLAVGFGGGGTGLGWPTGTPDGSGGGGGGNYPPMIDDGDPRRGMFPTGASNTAVPDASGVYANMTGPARETWARLLAIRPDLASHITSTYRDRAHNKRAGGANNSQHIHGNAFDLHVPGLSQADTIALIEDAKRAGFSGIGVYGPGTLHFDVGPKRAWGPSYGSDSIPGWARPYVY